MQSALTSILTKAFSWDWPSTVTRRSFCHTGGIAVLSHRISKKAWMQWTTSSFRTLNLCHFSSSMRKCSEPTLDACTSSWRSCCLMSSFIGVSVRSRRSSDMIFPIFSVDVRSVL